MEIKKAYVKDLIVLCNMIDSFDEFSQDFHELMKMNYDVDVIIKLCNIGFTIKADKKFFDSKNMKMIKDFYQKHEEEINIINEYSSLWDFLHDNYDFKGNLTTGEWENGMNFSFFYQYFLEHKNQLEQILLTLEKMRKLEIGGLEFDELETFTDKVFESSTTPLVFDFEYLENMEVISNYEEKWVKYRSLGSNYKIVISNPNLRSFWNFDEKNEIVVNNLLFDPKRLPKNLSEEVLFADIRKFMDEEGEKWAKIRANIASSVSLSIATDDLMDEFNSTNEVVQELENIKEREELLAILHKIKEGLEELRLTSEEYSDSICDDLITKDRIERVKCNRLEKRRGYHHFY